MEKIVCTITIEVDEPTKHIDVHMDFDNEEMPHEWELMSLAQKIAATFQLSAEVVTKSVLENEEERRESAHSGPKYPTRCRIVDPEGEKVFENETHEAIALQNPSKAVPKLGRTGMAHLQPDGVNVRIELDDGSELMGYECWWEPIFDVN